MVVFTKTDKTLLDRAARIVHNQAVIEETSYKGESWSTSEVGKEAKKRYDRLLRDERDLSANDKRLDKELPTVVYPAAGPANELKTGGVE